MSTILTIIGVILCLILYFIFKIIRSIFRSLSKWVREQLLLHRLHKEEYAQSSQNSVEHDDSWTYDNVYKRKASFEGFDRYLTFSEFERAVLSVTRRIKRIESTRVGHDDALVECSVRSQSGISTWEFEIDFNDRGRVTGGYDVWSENYDSDIPKRVAEQIRERIIETRDQNVNNGNERTRQIACPSCGQVMSVPWLYQTIVVTCPTCESKGKLRPGEREFDEWTAS